ncbi:sensor histidine kinase [Paenibacillus sp. FSL W7-1287]|uniref:sensor histidine kinase n=1 Tax=Paenibacillus sp. FSL W7-1287 TaxID=2954538 RepID=UPI0030F6F97D
MRSIKRLHEWATGRLVNKLNLLFSAIIILVVGSLTLISYQMLQKEAIGHSISSTSNNLKLVNQNLEDYVKEMEKRSLPQSNFDELSYAFVHEAESYSSKMLIEEYLRSIFYNEMDLEGIYLYLFNSGKYYEVKRLRNDITISTHEDTSPIEQPWYEEALQSQFNRSYQSLEFTTIEDSYHARAEQGYFAYHRVMRSIATRTPQAVISFYYNRTVFDDIVKDIPIEGDEQLFWLSPTNELFMASNQDTYKQLVDHQVIDALTDEHDGQYSYTIDDHKYLVIYNIGDKEGWKLIKQIPYTQINASAKQSLQFSLLIGIGFLVLAVLLVFIFASHITKPLIRLSTQMKRFSAGDFDATLEVVGTDELAYISHRFNSMVRRTNELINERYKLKLAEKNAVLKALEAEINPHFLYNALQAISTKALKNGQLEIVDMVDSLAMSLRYCISGSDIVTAQEELKHIGHYLAIQKARFGERLIVNMDVPEALTTIDVPKLSIQTLVENAVKHGLEKVSTPVTINISVRSEEHHVTITVENNGPAIVQEKLAEIRHWLAQDWEEALYKQESIGLVNLNARLKLLYGNESRLEIESDENSTRMIIILTRGGSRGND